MCIQLRQNQNNKNQESTNSSRHRKLSKLYTVLMSFGSSFQHLGPSTVNSLEYVLCLALCEVATSRLADAEQKERRKVYVTPGYLGRNVQRGTPRFQFISIKSNYQIIQNYQNYNQDAACVG